MRGRGMQWWDEWARRDPIYNPASYEQVATLMLASGDRAAANEIRYLGQLRQRETETGWGATLSGGLLRGLAGFGIGDYTFRVLYWVFGISIVGAACLAMCDIGESERSILVLGRQP